MAVVCSSTVFWNESETKRFRSKQEFFPITFDKNVNLFGTTAADQAGTADM